MEPEKFCQSCTFPMDKMEDRGTEKNGSRSDLYCKYCYKDGAFTDPGMTLDRMKEIATREMGKQHLPDSIILQSIAMLPHLKRWQEPLLKS
jgi:hypothetical protein